MGYINMKKFNKDKYLKKLKFKKYKRYLYIGIPCILVLLIGIYFAYSKFSVFKEEEVVRTTVGDFISGDVVIGAYIDGEYSNTIPGKNDGYVVDKIVCDNDASASWDNDSWGIMVTNLTKRTKCNVYFKRGIKIGNLTAFVDELGKCPTINDDGTVNVTKKEVTDGYVCSASDAYGTSYYYRGNVTNNYVKFGKWPDDTPTVVVDGDGKQYDFLDDCEVYNYSGNCVELARAGKDMYWRIVRINGDGTVRVIYDGTSAHTNGESSMDRQIGVSAFNGLWKKNNAQEATNSSIYQDNAGVGYMYGNRDAIVESTEYYSSNKFANTGMFYISKEYMFDENKKMFTLKNPIQVLGSDLTTDYIGYYYTSYTPTSVPSSVDTLYKIMGITSGDSSAYVKYGYVTYGTSSKEVAQTNKNDSAIKKYLDNWYKTNISGTENEQYLADNIFCNDRSFSSSNSGTGAGVSCTKYNWYDWHASNLKCPQQNDAFAVSDTTNGNGALTYPIGLISTDEVFLAGGYIRDENNGYYLYSGSTYWTSSPYWFAGLGAFMYDVYSNGGASDWRSTYGIYGVRPVINLKAEVLAQGSGTATDPYHLSS